MTADACNTCGTTPGLAWDSHTIWATCPACGDCERIERRGWQADNYEETP